MKVVDEPGGGVTIRKELWSAAPVLWALVPSGLPASLAFGQNLIGFSFLGVMALLFRAKFRAPVDSAEGVVRRVEREITVAPGGGYRNAAGANVRVDGKSFGRAVDVRVFDRVEQAKSSAGETELAVYVVGENEALLVDHGYRREALLEAARALRRIVHPTRSDEEMEIGKEESPGQTRMHLLFALELAAVIGATGPSIWSQPAWIGMLITIAVYALIAFLAPAGARAAQGKAHRRHYRELLDLEGEG